MLRSTLASELVCCLLFGSALAQDPAVSIPIRESFRREPAATIRVNSNLVLVPVMVTDGDDRLVTGLEKRDFRIYDDSVEQEISHFAQDDAPVSVILLIDNSGSMRNKLRKARLAIEEFLKAANPEDEFALIEFSNKPQILAPFTRDSGNIESQLALLAPSGRTALLDAIYLAFNELKHAKNTRKAILIFSDGGDNHSRYGEREVMERVRESDAQVYSIGILNRGERWRSREEILGPQLLNAVSEQSGGRYFEADGPEGLPEIATKIGSALRNQYLLGYAPAIAKRDGRYHRITVKLEQPKGPPRLRATFRPSYLAPER